MALLPTLPEKQLEARLASGRCLDQSSDSRHRFDALKNTLDPADSASAEQRKEEGDKMPTLLGSTTSARPPLPLLKQANVAAGTVLINHGNVAGVYEIGARNAALSSSEAGGSLRVGLSLKFTR